MTTPQQTTSHDNELHHTVSDTFTGVMESTESQFSESTRLPHPVPPTSVAASTVPSELPGSPNSTPSSASRPSKRIKTTQINETGTSSIPSIVGSAQQAMQVASRPVPRLVIRMPRRSRSPPARTVHLLGGFLQPGDPQYETARRATGDRHPYWFRGDNMPGHRDSDLGVGGAERLRSVEKAEEVVEIRLDEEEEKIDEETGKMDVRTG